ncbi:O-antigen ligase family protein [Effusibacillus pohliae]|uniref:O-antigen ligase family protein n=1 Tax=Effusibacillus pohliae TaxID=232270 RepID=UPI001FE1E1AA|nr:O-antigen ligase family protein [Effusibacillus pohliae]
MERFKLWSLTALCFFPAVDFLLRKIPVAGSVVGPLWDKLILTGLAALAAGRFLAGERLEPLPHYRMLKAFWLLGIAYLAVGLASFSIDFEGFRAIYWYSLFAFVLPFCVDRALAEKLVRYALFAALLIGLHGVYQYVTKAPMPPGWVDASETVRTRVYSVFGSPNIMGSYMALMFPIAAGMTLSTRSTRERVLFALIALVTLASLLFTYTRGAWLALFAALAVTAALFDRRLLLLILIAAVAAMFVPQVHTRVFQLFDKVYWLKAARDGRIARWLTAYDVIRGNPFFGAGMGHFGGAVAARRLGINYVDNYYAKTAAEMGLVGLSAMLALFVTVVRDLYSRIFKPLRARQEWPLLLGMFTGILAVLLQNGVENVFEVPAMNFLFWFFVSLTVILTRSGEKEGHTA